MHLTSVGELNDGLFVNTAKHTGVETFFQLLHRDVEYEPPMRSACENQFIFGLERDDLIHIHHNEFGARPGHEALQLPPIPPRFLQVSALRARPDRVQSRKALGQALLSDRFQKVVESMHLECTDGVVTVGSCENDDGPFVLWKGIQNCKAIQPGHLDVEEYDVRLQLLNGCNG